MPQPLVQRDEIRLAMLGMVDGNGHPYSWSAIFNGYDQAAMDASPYPGIADYLRKEPFETLRIPGAKVTHIWTDDPADARSVAHASLIPHIVERPEDVIGQVDAVLVATDYGHEHVARSRPFVEAGVPVFVDKPLADNEADLRTFVEWVNAGKPILSSSGLRYAKELMPLRASTNDLGALRFVSATSHKNWERYGIHMLEAVYPVLGPGLQTVRCAGTDERTVTHLTHRSGVDIVLVNSYDMLGGFGKFQFCGTAGSAYIGFSDTFFAFKKQLESYVHYLRTGQRPFPFAETVELMQAVIGAIASRAAGGSEIALIDIAVPAVSE